MFQRTIEYGELVKNWFYWYKSTNWYEYSFSTWEYIPDITHIS